MTKTSEAVSELDRILVGIAKTVTFLAGLGMPTPSAWEEYRSLSVRAWSNVEPKTIEGLEPRYFVSLERISRVVDHLVDCQKCSKDYVENVPEGFGKEEYEAVLVLLATKFNRLGLIRSVLEGYGFTGVYFYCAEGEMIPKVWNLKTKFTGMGRPSVSELVKALRGVVDTFGGNHGDVLESAINIASKGVN